MKSLKKMIAFIFTFFSLCTIIIFHIFLVENTNSVSDNIIAGILSISTQLLTFYFNIMVHRFADKEEVK